MDTKSDAGQSQGENGDHSSNMLISRHFEIPDGVPPRDPLLEAAGMIG